MLNNKLCAAKSKQIGPSVSAIINSYISHSCHLLECDLSALLWDHTTSDVLSLLPLPLTMCEITF